MLSWVEEAGIIEATDGVPDFTLSVGPMSDDYFIDLSELEYCDDPVHNKLVDYYTKDYILEN